MAVTLATASRTRPLRSIGLLLVCLTACVPLFFTTGIAKAADIPGCSPIMGSSYNWSQDACITYNGHLIAQSDVFLGSAFNGSHVNACDLEATLVATYGVTHTVHIDCRDLARAHIDFATPLLDFGTGSGKRGDGYSLHACLTVTTGIVYSTCAPGLHPSSPIIYPWGR
jgi:hypothetical protein